MPRTQAIDLSHWNTVESFSAVKASGVVGVLHKCTEGTTFFDSQYSKRKSDILAVGLRFGAYHFLKHGNVLDQMKWFAGNHKLPNGSRLAVDYEDPACTLVDLQEALLQLGNLNRTMQISVYSGHLLKDQVGSKVIEWLKPYSLWLAHYTTGTPAWPKQIWPTWSLWQFTEKGRCEGIKGDCDLDTFAGNDEQCAKWFGPVGPAKPAQPEAQPVVSISLNVPDGVRVDLTVNGMAVKI